MFVLTKHLKKKRGGVQTWVGHEFERSAEFSVAGRSPGPDVEDVRSERTQAFNIGTAGRRLHDAVAALVLVLISHKTKRERNSI